MIGALDGGQRDAISNPLRDLRKKRILNEMPSREIKAMMKSSTCEFKTTSRLPPAVGAPVEMEIARHLAIIDELLQNTQDSPCNSPATVEENAAQIAIRSHLRNVAALIGVLCADRLPGRSGLPRFPLSRHRILLQPYVEQFLDTATEVQQQVLPNYKPLAIVELRPKFTRESLFETLTEREKDVLTMVLSGESNKIIAYKMNIREATVKAHVSSLLRKFAVPSRTRLIAIFRGS
ncbi:LuxR C-terminal-related transcriptional regulator [Rhodoblastus sp.]|uniref:helix-turn-helix transcriptional regulator n=1 Tax=Rhodoblastus sp. TaxID=1962975 RepID=UPI0026300937|nr:LuxR C-terminal-related transcriptional regulator [Rhodoblastus sp.]